ncbi:hypothetical protein [Thermaerobacillus caldiproteolyticus]|uniref:LAS superfamily LD-carboxypeptidase LdcB n=1 Tax=Thermaerobacillus caldiproteolyticus TaxID=247480 RepID=A0A7V9Z6N5_9BACL|nr:hypothetical protein [Anoxybacillus caldiproteolyticus]MBA2875030.1 LAS superfamily LD-carboxypeptidase LdcB [Anoxybacillus caldiproteolyticus]QPA32991.1 hypothetical protein ISX45_09020 [Anoxybacillus caldiproteolyticus]
MKMGAIGLIDELVAFIVLLNCLVLLCRITFAVEIMKISTDEAHWLQDIAAALTFFLSYPEFKSYFLF